MSAARSDHHRRQAEDYNEVPAIPCDYGFFTDSKDDDRQVTEAEATAVGASDPGQVKQNDSCRCCALGRKVGEKLKEAGVKAMQNTSPAYDSRPPGHA